MPADAAGKQQGVMADPEWQSWFAGKEFTSDWTTHNFPLWTSLLAPLRDKGTRILEIGSNEGRSAISFLEFLPDATITCVDIFPDPNQTRFDANLAGYGSRVTKLRGRSVIHLDRLRQEEAQFDLIYIDGSHRRDDTLVDSVLAWSVLRTGGILLWDDYKWRPELSPPERPEGAVDAFLATCADELSELHRGYQAAVRKELPGFRGPPPPSSPPPPPPARRYVARNFRNFGRFLRGTLIRGY